MKIVAVFLAGFAAACALLYAGVNRLVYGQMTRITGANRSRVVVSREANPDE